MFAIILKKNLGNATFRFSFQYQQVIRMTPEEERIYKECNKEAFIKKGIPYGSMAAISTFVAIKTGFLKTSPMFGYYPVLATAGCLGALVGIISHKATCVQKILDLPNSHLKQMVDASLKRLEQQTYVHLFINSPSIFSSIIKHYQCSLFSIIHNQRLTNNFLFYSTKNSTRSLTEELPCAL